MAGDETGSSFEFIGRNIREIRKAKKWTQEELGQKLRRRKLSRQAISWIESGRNTDLETIADVAGTLGVALGELLQGQVTARALTRALPQPDANTLVEELLARPIESWPGATRDSKYESSAVVRTLLNRADAAYDVSAVRTLAINEVAANIARAADVDPELRVESLKDLANTAARMGDHQYALRVLDEAEAVARACSESDYQSAIVTFARAVVYVYAERLREIPPLLQSVSKDFVKRDRRRFLLAKHLEALVLAETGHPREAVQLIDGFIDEITTWGDEDELSRLYTVVSAAWRDSGNRDLALQYLEKSAEIHSRKSQLIEIAGDDLRRGQIDAAFGDYDRALAAFRRAREQFVRLHLKIHVLSVDLMVLRAKIASGSDRREVYELCSRLAAEASAADLPVTASEAIDWLRRIASRITPEAVDHVLSFVRDAETHPDLRFEPPDA